MIRSKAPLRLGLAGGGTDVSPYSDIYGGNVLNATIDLFAHTTLRKNNDKKIIFVAQDQGKKFETSLTEFIPLEGDLILQKAIYNRIIKEFNQGQPLPITLYTYSDAPPGSGLGTSSTMVVSILKAMQEALSLPLGEYDLARLAYEIERKDAKMSGGKQDQYSAAFGGFNFMEFYAEDRVIVNPLRVKKEIINELESSMILYFTGASRESAKIIDEQIKNVHSKNTKSIDAMHELKKDALSMKEALLKGDIKTFATYLNKSWEAKKQMASSISNEFINRIYDTAIQAGAYAGKVSGAGGGGYMFFIVDPIKKLKVINSLNELGGYCINFHFYKHGTEAWRIR